MEYIWNGFDADAIKVDLTYSVNELGGISEIRICDNGTGRNFENIENTFGALDMDYINKNEYDVSKKEKTEIKFITLVGVINAFQEKQILIETNGYSRN